MDKREVLRGQELEDRNISEKDRLLLIAEEDEKKEEEAEQKALSIAERMMRRAQNKTFTLTFLDTGNDDEIPIEFRILYSKERREVLELAEEVLTLQTLESADDISKLNDCMDKLKEYVKAVTVTEGMNNYYDSSLCQDTDIYEIIRAVIARTVGTVEEARSFRG